MAQFFSSKKFHLFLICAACFGAGIFVSENFIGRKAEEDTSNVLRAGKRDYTYIDPLLLCQNYENGEFARLEPIKKEIERITDEARTSNTISAGSVYFRDLQSGQWTGVAEDELYAPASLLKVPILIAYLKALEKEVGLFDETLFYAREAGQVPPLIKDFILNSGQRYSIEDLLRGMIIDSDNSAKNILEGRMNKDFLNEIYSELGVPSPYYGENSYRISTKTYALFFRVLYNATFLSRDMSEKAFDILAEVKFDKGLRAGTPEHIRVAHKYGYSIIKRDPPRILELSDCGVVYNPDKPYLLCVMARGSDPEVTATYIKDVASAVSRLFTE
ncbi:MAG: serine hydrolase [bacterium]|nr:serine hydrolase [bacterium]